MPGLLINIDVPDLTAGEHFYTNALGLTAARRFDDDIVELTGCEVPIYLILKPAGRSEEHTSELQSLMRISYAVFCLKKKKHNYTNHNHHDISSIQDNQYQALYTPYTQDMH